MAKRKMTGAEGFFYNHAGFVRGKRRQGAESLAHAESVATSEGWQVEWRHDDSGYLDTRNDDVPPTEVLCAVLTDAAGNVLASLGCIGDPSDSYRRVVEAELAAEALDRAEELTKRARRAGEWAMNRFLPEGLRAAYDWVDAAGEIEDLRRMGSDDAHRYANEAHANAVENDVNDVSASDLVDLHEWLSKGEGK